MKLTTINRSAHRAIATDMASALKAVGDKYGIDITANGGSYGGDMARFRIDAVVRDTGGGISGAEAEFRNAAVIHGIDPNCFGKSFRFKNKSYEICTYQATAPKYCIGAKTPDGTVFRFTAPHIAGIFPAKTGAVA